MNARTVALAWVLTAAAFLALDAVWLTVMSERLYRPAIGHLLQDGFSVLPAALFYLVYISAIVYFAVAPGLTRKAARHAWVQGAVLGFVAYATYDLTNQATLRDWPWVVTVADLIWGSFVTGTSAALATTAALRLVRRS